MGAIEHLLLVISFPESMTTNSESPTNTIEVLMRNPRKRHLAKLDMTGAGIFAPPHKQPPSFWGWESWGENLKRCRLQKSAKSFDLKLSIHIDSHLPLQKRKNEKGKRSRFSKLQRITVHFLVCYIFCHRIVCFLLANVILFVNINPSRWGTQNGNWSGWEYKKHSKDEYCSVVIVYKTTKHHLSKGACENTPFTSSAFSPDGNDGCYIFCLPKSPRCHRIDVAPAHLPIKKTFQPAIRWVCRFHWPRVYVNEKITFRCGFLLSLHYELMNWWMKGKSLFLNWSISFCHHLSHICPECLTHTVMLA